MTNKNHDTRLFARLVTGLALAALASAAGAAETDKGKPQGPEKTEIRKVIVIDGQTVSETVEKDGDKKIIVRRVEGGAAPSATGETRRVIIRRAGDGPADAIMLGDEDGLAADGCKDANGRDAKPLIDEKVEDGAANEKRVMRTIICAGPHEAASPKEEAEALKAALARMEDDFKREAAQREKMMQAIRDRIAELEKAPQ